MPHKAVQDESSAGVSAGVSAVSASPVDFDAYGTIYHPKGLPPAPSHLGGRHQNAYPFRGRIETGGEFPPKPGGITSMCLTPAPLPSAR